MENSIALSDFLNGYTSVSLYSQHSLSSDSVRVAQKNVMLHKKMLCCTKKSLLNSVGSMGGVGQTLAWVAWVCKILAWVKKMVQVVWVESLAWVAWVHKNLAWVARVDILAWITWWCEWRGSIKYSLDSYHFFPHNNNILMV